MKKKTTSLRLQIPDPCSESWEEMTPLPGGRYCRCCEKTVVDFTTMTGQQITRLYQRRQGRVCGRFYMDQLEKDLPLPEPAGRWQKFRALGALLSGLLLSGAAAAQTAVQKPAAAVQPSVQKPGETPARTVKGVVTDEAGEPLIGASIALTDDTGRIITGTVSLEDGRFGLKIPANTGQLGLKFSYVGYDNQELELERAQLHEEKRIEVQMKQVSHELAEALVIAYRGPVMRGLITGIVVARNGEKEEKKEPQAPVEEAEVVNLFPNPFTSFVNVELDLPEPGRLLFHLYDASGKLVFAQAEELPQGRQLLNLDLSGRCLPAGTYFLRISDEAGEVRTKPLVKVE